MKYLYYISILIVFLVICFDIIVIYQDKASLVVLVTSLIAINGISMLVLLLQHIFPQNDDVKICTPTNLENEQNISSQKNVTCNTNHGDSDNTLQYITWEKAMFQRFMDRWNDLFENLSLFH